MAQGYAAEQIGVLDSTLNPAAKSDGIVSGAKLRRLRATLDCAAATTKLASGDTNVLGVLPPGSVFAFGVINASVTMGGTATIAIGPSGTPAKYRTAAIFTAAAPTLFGNSSAVDDAALTAPETVLMTIAAASLPGAGILVIDLYYSAR